ncbi:MAG: Trehalose import ATP-binding protein SugC [Chloroflexi bacterium ADurb.Bin180]|nr:MAG: Trehalose import ATP-binding protein SugC [Chloroflexi bacterium ADurb.Bin180]
MATIVLKDLVKKYGDVEAVKGINLEIRHKEFFCFLGPSGCGKTSTLRVIAGLEDITAGEVWIGDRKVNGLAPADRDVSMAFETYALYPPLTVRENLAFPLAARGATKEAIANKVAEVARILDLSDVLDKKPDQISGGHQQRVSLGRCIIRSPNAFLFDEPLSHVDSKARRQMRGEIRRIQLSLGITSLYVTHDQSEALALADRVMIMNAGEIQQVGTPDEVYDRPANLFVADFVGEPPFNLLDCRLVKEDGVSRFRLDKGGFSLRVPDRLLPLLADHGDQVLKLGIRPMYIVPRLTQPEERTVAGKVYVFENLGEEGVLTVDVAGDLVRVTTTPDFRGKSGDPVWLDMDTSRVHVFDPVTTRNITLD